MQQDSSLMRSSFSNPAFTPDMTVKEIGDLDT